MLQYYISLYRHFTACITEFVRESQAVVNICERHSSSPLFPSPYQFQRHLKLVIIPDGVTMRACPLMNIHPRADKERRRRESFSGDKTV